MVAMDRFVMSHDFWNTINPAVEGMCLNDRRSEIDPKERTEICGLLPNLQGKIVLELGSGIGRYTNFFAENAKKVVTVDFVERFVEKNREQNGHYGNIEFVCDDVINLDFKPGSFHFIFINGLFTYLTDTEVFSLRQRIFDWLKNSGMLFFRESCALYRIDPRKGNPATYRTLYFYTHLFDGHLELIEEKNVNVSINTFANPFPCYWIYKK